MDFWESIYSLLGIKDFIYFISSPQLQDALFPVKLIFISFGMFFLAGVIYFMLTSSWLQYKFLEDVTEFVSWKAAGLKEISRRWGRIQKRADTGLQSEFKLAIIEADDFLTEMMEDRGFTGNNFEELAKSAGVIFPNLDEIMEVHKTRNSIVYEPDYKTDQAKTREMLFLINAWDRSL